MGDLPKINGKIGKKFPNRGEGGVPDLGKIPTFSRFFLANVPYLSGIGKISMEKTSKEIENDLLEEDR